MTSEEYKELIQKYKKLKTNNIKASFIILSLLSTTFFSLYLSLSENNTIWFIGQILFGINVIQWFSTLHDLGHNHYFTNKRVNSVVGHVASFICILPYYPWKFIHREHHVWTGWKDLDPTMTIVAPRELSSGKMKFVNFCWKFWIPIMTLSFSFDNFWNVKKLNKMYPSKKFQWRNTFSILFLLLSYATLLYFIPWSVFIKAWGLGYLIFLLLSDPLLISQHSGVDQMVSTPGEKPEKVHFRNQDEYTRALVFPNWITKFILIGFNKHILHHYFPTVPGYQLMKMNVEFKNTEDWFQWLKKAKSTEAISLLFKNIKKT